jgi:hypothetical protein
MKKFYVGAWFLAAIAVLISVLTGTFTTTAMIVFSFIGLGLIYTLALWSVIVNTRETPSDDSFRNGKSNL